MVSETKGRRFESCRARQSFIYKNPGLIVPGFLIQSLERLKGSDSGTGFLCVRMAAKSALALAVIAALSLAGSVVVGQA